MYTLTTLLVPVVTSSTSWAVPKFSGKKWSKLAIGRHPRDYWQKCTLNRINTKPTTTYSGYILHIFPLNVSYDKYLHFGKIMKCQIINRITMVTIRYCTCVAIVTAWFIYTEGLISVSLIRYNQLSSLSCKYLKCIVSLP